jgi:hypothetical protein
VLAWSEAQPAELVSTTESDDVPTVPAVNVIWFVPCPAVIVPFVIPQTYVLPLCEVTDAVRPAARGVTDAGATITGVAGIGLTVTTVAGEVPGMPFTVTVTEWLPDADTTIARVVCPPGLQR